MESGIKMSDKPTSEKIINEIAGELVAENQENTSDIENVENEENLKEEHIPEEEEINEGPTEIDKVMYHQHPHKIGWFKKLISNFKGKKKTKNENSDSTSLSFDELRKKKGIQNLEERSKLLNILKWLFGIQLVFMNLIVALIIIWVIFKCEHFNNVDKEVLGLVVSFVKSYITVVLAELLGGIIYVTHKVFSEKFNDNLTK